MNTAAPLYHALIRWTVCAVALSPVLSGCSSDSPTAPADTPQASGEIIYSRYRNILGNVAPVFTEGGGFDGGEVDSPALVKDGGRPGGDKFMMYYEAEDGGGTSTIGLITSNEEDFVVLSIGRTQVVPLGSGGGPYAAAATDPTVVLDKRPTQVAARYKMWFEGRNAGGASTILYGTSADGVSWSTFAPCTGLNPSFGGVRVADPSVALEDSVYKMWFEAINSTTGTGDGPGTLGYAESLDGITWTVRDGAGNTGGAAGPVFGPGGGFDGYSVNAPCVVLDTMLAPGITGRYKLWYEAGDKPGDVQNSIGYATSGNGFSWNRTTLPVLDPSSDAKVPLPFDSGDLEHPTAVIDYDLAPNVEGHFLLWYTGDPEGGGAPNRIGLAKGRLP